LLQLTIKLFLEGKKLNSVLGKYLFSDIGASSMTDISGNYMLPSEERI